MWPVGQLTVIRGADVAHEMHSIIWTNTTG